MRTKTFEVHTILLSLSVTILLVATISLSLPEIVAQSPAEQDRATRHAATEKEFEEAKKLAAEATANNSEKSLRAAVQRLNVVATEFIALKDPAKAAEAFEVLAKIHFTLAEADKTIEYLNKLAVLYREAERLNQEGDVFELLGFVHRDLGQSQKALECFERSLAIAREIGNRSGELTALGNIGSAYSDLGRPLMALEYYKKSLAMARQTKDRLGEKTILNNIGLVYFNLGQPWKALEHYEMSLAIAREIGENEGTILNNIGGIYKYLGQTRKALECFERSLAIAREIGNRSGELTALGNIGSAYSNLGQIRKALEHSEKALAIARELEDRLGEGRMLNNIGLNYSNLGDLRNALEYYEKALAIAREKGNRALEGTILGNIGLEFNRISDNQKALDHYEEALTIARETDDRSGEGTLLNNIGLVYIDLSQPQRALEYFKKSLAIARETGNRFGEGTTLGNIGRAYIDLSESQKALEFLDKSLAIARETGDLKSEGVTLNKIGGVYGDLGQPQKALGYHERALAIARETGYRSGEGTALNNIGLIFASLGESERALECYEKIIAIARESGELSAEVTALNNIGGVYGDLGQLQKALEYHEKSLSLAREIGDRSGEGAALNNIGGVYGDLGQPQKALQYYRKALAIALKNESRRREGITLDNLSNLHAKLGNKRLAIFYGKQSVNTYQELRGLIQGLEREAQLSFLTSVEGAYRHLADLLVSEGRFAEAQQVLAMLKEEEYFSYVRRDSEEIKRLSTRIDLRPEEKAVLARYEELGGRVAENGARLQRLEELKKLQGDEFEQQAEYDEVKAKIEVANKAFLIFLEKEIAGMFPATVKKEIELDRALQGRLAEWGDGTVTLYTILGDDRYRVILTTPTVQVDGKTDIKAEDLNRKIFAFREALQNPWVDPRPLAKELYDILVKPIERELAASGAKTLVWSLDGALRYIPMAALSPDGEGYLVSRYRNVVVSSTIGGDRHRDNAFGTDKERNPWSIFGAGVTRASRVKDPVTSDPIEFTALPGVEDELRSIVREREDETGVLGGRRVVDEPFDVAALEGVMSGNADGRLDVIHLATHFRLGVDNSRSFLLLGGDRTLSLAEVGRNERLDFNGIDLVTLSACETGFGTATENRAGGQARNFGAEVDSLATFIELRGARSVMASLWPIADESTSVLMTEFYRLKGLNPAMTKAEALREAQRAMLAGNLKAGEGAAVCRSPANTDASKGRPFECPADAPYSHPYFWSPFVLIGNWR